MAYHLMWSSTKCKKPEIKSSFSISAGNDKKKLKKQQHYFLLARVKVWDLKKKKEKHEPDQ